MTQPLHASGTTQSRSSIAPVHQSKVITATDLDACFKMIGKTAFSMDDVFLNDYLQHVLGWWYGERLAQGVGIPLDRRCWYVVFLMSRSEPNRGHFRSCEYHVDCEWRKGNVA